LTIDAKARVDIFLHQVEERTGYGTIVIEREVEQEESFHSAHRIRGNEHILYEERVEDGRRGRATVTRRGEPMRASDCPSVGSKSNRRIPSPSPSAVASSRRGIKKVKVVALVDNV